MVEQLRRGRREVERCGGGERCVKGKQRRLTLEESREEDCEVSFRELRDLPSWFERIWAYTLITSVGRKKSLKT